MRLSNFLVQKPKNISIQQWNQYQYATLKSNGRNWTQASLPKSLSRLGVRRLQDLSHSGYWSPLFTSDFHKILSIAFSPVRIPTILEPPSVSQSNGKKPDGLF